MTNIGFMAVFPAMLFCVCVGLPLIWLQLFITSSRKDNYIKKAHKVKGKEVSHKDLMTKDIILQSMILIINVC